MEDYAVCHKIGDGAQGVVYEVKHIHSEQHYAMKVIRCTNQEQVNLALKEIKLLLRLRHPNIVTYEDFHLVFNNAKARSAFEFATRDGKTNVEADEGSVRLYSLSNSLLEGDADSDGGNGRVRVGVLSDEAVRSYLLGKEEIAVCIIMELCRSGDMQDVIKDAKQKMMETGSHPIKEEMILAWMEQCAAALHFIHSNGFLHRDLKPTNIFFDDSREIKVGDFGLAAAIGLGRSSVVGSPYYLAPELMLQQRYDNKVDVWGLGVIILELTTLREQPVNSMVLQDPNVADSLVRNVTKMGFSSKLAALLRDMLNRHPEERPNTTTILQRLSCLSPASPHLGLSCSMFLGMSCPKLADALCAYCEVEPATMVCSVCKCAYCTACDTARHKHPSRQSHERTSTQSFMSSVLQQTLSSSRTSPTTTMSDHPGHHGGASSFQSHLALQQQHHLQHSGQSQHTSHELSTSANRSIARFQVALPGTSASMSDFSMTNVLPRRDITHADTIARVPEDFTDLAAALAAVVTMPQIRKIVVSKNLVYSFPLVLTSALPENIRIVGESPSPVLEVADSPFALHCASGKGTLENFVIRHVGKSSTPLQLLSKNGGEAGSPKEKKPPRPIAVLMSGGEWRLHKCRISCIKGCGVTVGGGGGGGGNSSGDDAEAGKHHRQHRSGNIKGKGSTTATVIDADSSYEQEAKIHLDPVVTKCTFMDVTTAGVIVNERARGLFEGNTFSGCGYAAFLLKRGCTPRIRGNLITDGVETGVFCHDAAGTIEYNLIAQNTGCGVVIMGASATPVVRKNRVINNGQAGFFCCDHASPFICDNEIKQNHKAGVLIKTKAAPKVTRNTIEDGKEAGVYIFEGGSGIIEENSIRGNRNAGLLVTTQGSPHVIKNIMAKNAYEGIWVCKGGAGTFCDNDLRGNTKGPKDIEKDCKVVWVGNTEE